MINIIKKNKFFLIMLMGFFLSTSYSIYTVNNFDKINLKKNSHLMIRGDLKLVWKEANIFKNDYFVKNKKYFESGLEYNRTYLPSKLLAIYSQISNHEFFEDTEHNRVSVGGKLNYLLFQSLIFYIALFYFYRKLKLFLNNDNLSFYIVSFLSLEPTILQWHSTFWTESIYFTLQILLLSFILDKNISYIKFIKIGTILGLMYFQKTVTIFLFVPIIIYFLLIKLKKKFFYISLLSLTYALFLGFLCLDNYKKTDIAYILPSQTKDAHYLYIIPSILKEINKNFNYSEYKDSIEKDWKNSNDFNENNFKDLYDFYNFKQSTAIRIMLENKIITTKIYIKKILHHSLLNPIQTFYWHEYNKSQYDKEYFLSDDKKKWLLFRIIYSIIFFSIIVLGLLKVFRSSFNIKFHLLILFGIIYYSFMLGWVGNTRYFMPSWIFFSIFFGMGICAIEDIYINYKKKLA